MFTVLSIYILVGIILPFSGEILLFIIITRLLRRRRVNLRWCSSRLKMFFTIYIQENARAAHTFKLLKNVYVIFFSFFRVNFNITAAVLFLLLPLLLLRDAALSVCSSRMSILSEYKTKIKVMCVCVCAVGSYTDLPLSRACDDVCMYINMLCSPAGGRNASHFFLIYARDLPAERIFIIRR